MEDHWRRPYVGGLVAGYPSNFNRVRQVCFGAVEEWGTLESDGVAGGENFRRKKYVAGVWARRGSLGGNVVHKHIVAVKKSFSDEQRC